MSTFLLRRVAFLGVAATGCAVAVAACSPKSSDSGTPGAGGAAGFVGASTGGAAAGAPAVGAGGTVAPVGMGGAPVGAGGMMVVGAGGALPGGGAVGAGGAPGAGGMVTVGGASNASDIKIVGSTTLCAGAMPVVPNTPVSACSAMNCTGAHCVPMAQIPAGTDVTTLAKCPDGSSYCTPDDYIATQGQFQVKKCTSLEGAEGRCISTCIPQVAKQIDQLPKDVCMDSERCAPCFNPIDGSDTHACTQGCDKQTTMPPVLFAKCGIYAMDTSKTPRGLCVPKSLVPMNLQGIPQDTCKTDELCAPTEKVKDLNYNFPMCMPTGLAAALGLMANMAGQKGGCVPAYLAGTNASVLTMDECTGMGDLCAPCTNPLSTPTANAPTGACPWP